MAHSVQVDWISEKWQEGGICKCGNVDPFWYIMPVMCQGCGQTQRLRRCIVKKIRVDIPWWAFWCSGWKIGSGWKIEVKGE